MSYPKIEEFAEIFKFIQQYEIREHADGKLTAKNPATGVRYEAFLSGVKLYEEKGNFAVKELHDILDKPVRIESSVQFAWMLFCKLK